MPSSSRGSAADDATAFPGHAGRRWPLARWRSLARIVGSGWPMMDRALSALYDADAAARAIGIVLADVSIGRAVLRLRLTESMINGHGLAHGGYVFLLADTAFAYACNSHGPATVASGAEITFVAPARLGDELIATAVERTRFGRNGIYDVTVHRVDPSGTTVIAEFRGRSRVVDERA